MFFKDFPVVQYKFADSSPIVLTHILRRFKFRDQIKNMISEWDVYHIQENETPELVSYKFYGDVNYHWVILLFNDILDPFTDWPMNQESLAKYSFKRYGNPTDIHHWEKNGKAVPANTIGANAVTNIEFSEMVNEFNRKIRVPKTKHLKEITVELENILKETK